MQRSGGPLAVWQQGEGEKGLAGGMNTNWLDVIICLFLYRRGTHAQQYFDFQVGLITVIKDSLREKECSGKNFSWLSVSDLCR